MTDASDPRDGSMAGINGPLSPAQERILAMVPGKWAEVPRIGVPSLILRSLTDRGLVETRWANFAGEWQRRRWKSIPIE